jgi:hypothetical protein
VKQHGKVNHDEGRWPLCIYRNILIRHHQRLKKTKIIIKIRVVVCLIGIRIEYLLKAITVPSPCSVADPEDHGK